MLHSREEIDDDDVEDAHQAEKDSNHPVHLIKGIIYFSYSVVRKKKECYCCVLLIE